MLGIPKAVWGTIIFGLSLVAGLATLLANVETLDKHRVPRPVMSTELFDVAQATDENTVSILLIEIESLKRSTRETAFFIEQLKSKGETIPAAIEEGYLKDLHAIDEKSAKIAKIKAAIE